MELVMVYEHKRIEIKNEIKDMLKIAYVTYAEIKDDIAILDDPKGKRVKKISKMIDDIKNEDYIYQEANTKLIKFGDDSLSKNEILEKARNILINMYYEIIEKDGSLLYLNNIFDDKIKEEYERNVVPSLGDQLLSIIESKKRSDSFVLNNKMMNQILKKTTSLELQDSNTNKSIMDYDIKSMYSKLKEIIFGQDEQLKILLANIIKNISLSYSEFDIEEIKTLKSNILLIGPTGTGKTLMIESIAKMLDVPYIICDAKRYTSNGYKGEDIESILVDLYNRCGEIIENFNHGIIFIDEIDKLCNINDEESHVNTTDVQECILKFLDGTIINKTIRKGLTEESIPFDTSRIIFVLSGAFTEMLENEQKIDENILKKYGMISELSGRLELPIILKQPNKEDLKNSLLNGKYSYLKLFNAYLEMINVEYEISDEFVDYIVDLAIKINEGYRGLKKAIGYCVNEHLYDLISGDTKKFVYKIKKR